MVASISDTAVAHLAVKKLTRVSCNSYITVEISHGRAQESIFYVPIGMVLLLHFFTEWRAAHI